MRERFGHARRQLGDLAAQRAGEVRPPRDVARRESPARKARQVLEEQRVVVLGHDLRHLEFRIHRTCDPPNLVIRL